MKVLWLHEKLGAFGGAEANVLASAAALRDRGWTNELVCRETTGVSEDPWAEAFAKTRLGEDPVDAVRQASPDAVWIHNWPDSGAFTRLEKTGVPLGRMVHDHALYCMRHYKYHPLTRANCTRPASTACLFPCMAFLQRGAGRFPLAFASLGKKLEEIDRNRRLDRLVVASGFMRGELEKNGFDGAKIRVLPPVPPDPALPRAEGVSSVPGRMLYAGQVVRGKGVDLLIRALHGLEGDWTLSLAGQGSALEKCQKLASRLGLSGRLTVHGHLDAAGLSRQYREAQIVAVPSAWQEPFGMVGVEAMRHERPVVGFAVGGIPDWLKDGENGLLVAPGDVGALREALRRLLRDPAACQRMGRCGRGMAMTVFSFAGYVDNLQQVLTELAGSKKPARAR